MPGNFTSTLPLLFWVALSLDVVALFFRFHVLFYLICGNQKSWCDGEDQGQCSPPAFIACLLHWDGHDGSDRKAEQLREGSKIRQSYGDSGQTPSRLSASLTIDASSSVWCTCCPHATLVLAQCSICWGCTRENRHGLVFNRLCISNAFLIFPVETVIIFNNLISFDLFFCVPFLAAPCD